MKTGTGRGGEGTGLGHGARWHGLSVESCVELTGPRSLGSCINHVDTFWEKGSWKRQRVSTGGGGGRGMYVWTSIFFRFCSHNMPFKIDTHSGQLFFQLPLCFSCSFLLTPRSRAILTRN